MTFCSQQYRLAVTDKLKKKFPTFTMYQTTHELDRIICGIPLVEWCEQKEKKFFNYLENLERTIPADQTSNLRKFTKYLQKVRPKSDLKFIRIILLSLSMFYHLSFFFFKYIFKIFRSEFYKYRFSSVDSLRRSLKTEMNNAGNSIMCTHIQCFSFLTLYCKNSSVVICLFQHFFELQKRNQQMSDWD